MEAMYLSKSADFCRNVNNRERLIRRYNAQNHSDFASNSRCTQNSQHFSNFPLELQSELTSLKTEHKMSERLLQKLDKLLNILFANNIPLPSFLTPFQEGNRDVMYVEWNRPCFAILTLSALTDDVHFENRISKAMLSMHDSNFLWCVQMYVK